MSWLIGQGPDEGKVGDRRRRRWQRLRWLEGIMQWTCVWANSGAWWRTGKPSMLQSMWSQRVGHDLVTNKLEVTHTVKSSPTHSLCGKHFLLLSEPLLWVRCNYRNSWKTNTPDIPSSLSIPQRRRSPFHELGSHTHLQLHHPHHSLPVGDQTPCQKSTVLLISVGPDCAYVRIKVMDSFSQLSLHSNRRKYDLSGPPSSIFSLLSAAM